VAVSVSGEATVVNDESGMLLCCHRWCAVEVQGGSHGVVMCVGKRWSWHEGLGLDKFIKLKKNIEKCGSRIGFGFGFGFKS